MFRLMALAAILLFAQSVAAQQGPNTSRQAADTAGYRAKAMAFLTQDGHGGQRSSCALSRMPPDRI